MKLIWGCEFYIYYNLEFYVNARHACRYQGETCLKFDSVTT